VRLDDVDVLAEEALPLEEVLRRLLLVHRHVHTCACARVCACVCVCVRVHRHVHTCVCARVRVRTHFHVLAFTMHV
jgi:hypothetical protein